MSCPAPVDGFVLARAEGGVERGLGGLEREPADEADRLGRPDQPVHPGVLPLDRDGAGVADRPEGAEAVLPRHVAVARRHEVPAAAGVVPRQVRRQPPVAAVADPHPDVLAVDVVDPVLEVPDEGRRVEVLPDHVRRVPVEPERRAVADRLQRPHRGPVVVGDLARVHLVREADAHLVVDVEDRVPAVGEVLVAGLDRLLRTPAGTSRRTSRSPSR